MRSLRSPAQLPASLGCPHLPAVHTLPAGLSAGLRSWAVVPVQPAAETYITSDTWGWWMSDFGYCDMPHARTGLALPQAWNAGGVSPTGRSRWSDSRGSAGPLSAHTQSACVHPPPLVTHAAMHCKSSASGVSSLSPHAWGSWHVLPFDVML
jgi:hypothetical protein